MHGESFRFIHASDFHLERPLGDLDLLPPHLSEALVDAPWKAAEAVFEAAIVENVDFLILSGDLLNPVTAGPRGVGLLLDHFTELHERSIPVFWVTGEADAPQRWPEAIPLPPNVTRFPSGRAVSVPVQRAGRTIAVVVGRSCDGRSGLHVPSYRIDPTDQFTIAAGYGAADPAALAESRFDYWALGGEHHRQQLETASDGIAIYCGTPQGRSLEEEGAHGYQLVDVDADGTTRLHEVDVDTLRYFRVELEAEELAAGGNLRPLIGTRISRLLHENGDRHLLIAWQLRLPSGDSLVAPGDPQELLSWVRRDFGHGNPAAWTVQLDIEPPQRYPTTWHEEDTILGDFLRAAARQRKSGARDLVLAPMTEEHRGVTAATAALLADADPAVRPRLLSDATLLGVELLRGGKPNLSGGGSQAGKR